ncbi:hypothetical protein HO173_010444 [Letharia columbiana]|uniref:CENP-V/GFA domain-containing protein n=1 Tax=Letharia columbiana TaxID=112416 RepID=A0A8H6L0U2_9LECA|nr:uncharacterized protein HO173_010444 [Letharia columbiana]KAF6231301.1 hypothetical protein HO173_010444 [Letharia columbiana]
MSNSESPANVWYEANCHCGAIKYKVNVPSLETQKVTNCNCSICCKNGYLNVYPKRTDVVFHKGEDHMKGYLFGEERCMHKFCPTCGSSLFVDPHMDDPELIVVNVRMFKDIDVDKLELWKYDGFNRLQPRYDV